MTAELAEHSEATDHSYRNWYASVYENDRGGSAYRFVFASRGRLESVIEFDIVAFRTRPSDDSTIMTIEFFRRTPDGRTVQTGQVEGGRLDWGDDIVDTLDAIARGEFPG